MAVPNDLASDLVLDIDSLSYGRSAVARSNGRVIFVEGAAPGDRVRVELTGDHARYAEGRVTELIEAGKARVEAPCPIVGRCGGCPWQHVGYEDQLLAKRRAVLDSLERIAGVRGAPVRPVVPSPESFGYRNRLQLRFDGSRLGFYSARTHRLVPVPDCLVAEDRVRDALAVVERFVASLATQALRVEIASRGELAGVVIAINSRGRLRRADVFRVREFLGLPSNPVRGVEMWGKGWRRSWGDTRRRHAIDGATSLETRGGSFGQVNTGANRLLVEAVMELADAGSGDDVLDLYAGAGNFSLPLARRGARVQAVESDPRAADAGRASAEHQRIANVTFHAQSVETFLKKFTADRQGLSPARVVANPPRSGLDRTASAVAALATPKVVYVSCDPTTLARDLVSFLERGYEVTDIIPIDMFPHTFHVETVCGIELT